MKCMKNSKWSQKRVDKWWCGFEWCILNAEKVLNENMFKKMKSLCNRRVFVRNHNTSKEIVHFVHEVHPVFPVILSTFYHMLRGWNYDTMPNFQPFQRSFAVLFNFRVILAQNKSWNAWKIANEVRKGLKINDVALNGAYWKQKKSRVKLC